MGRADEALVVLKRALELDPLSTVINWEIGLPYYFSRQYDLAIEQFKRAVSTDPQNTFARSFLAGIYTLKGSHEEALKVVDEPGSEDSYLAAMTAYTYARMGRRAEAKKIAERLEMQAKQSYVSPFLFARVYVALGEKERAIEWLEKGYENREETSAWLNSDPSFDPLRSEPRFKELVRRIGLP